MSSADVQDQVRNRLKRDGNPLLDMMRAVDPAVDEKSFHDALAVLRGRFLLLIVGDRIRERDHASFTKSALACTDCFFGFCLTDASGEETVY